MRTTFACVILGALAAVITGCADTEASTDDSNEVVVSIHDVANKVTVKDDALEFDADLFAKIEPQLTKLTAYASATDKSALEPVYFIGDRQADAKDTDGALKANARNPVGYLRKALSWTKTDSGVIVIKTEHATLAEASNELQRSGYVFMSTTDPALKPSSLDPLAVPAEEDAAEGDGDGAPEDPTLKDEDVHGIGNWQKTWQHTFGGPDGFTPIDLSGTTLWEKKLLSGGSAKVTLTKGRINIKPTVDAKVLIQRFIPKNGHAILTTDVIGEIEFQATADGTFDFEKSGVIYSKKFGGAIKGFPLTMGIDVGWRCALGSSGRAVATMGAVAKGSLRAGGEFEGFHLKGILDPPTYTFEKIGPTLDANVTVKGECHVTSTITLQVFDAAGPNASVDLYGNLDVNAVAQQLSAKVDASLKVGVEAKVGGALKPFGVKIAEISTAPWKFEKEIFKGQIELGKKP